MRNILPFQSTRLLVLMASVAVAKGHDPNVRSIYLRHNTPGSSEQIYVAGQVVTLLRFQQPCDPEHTKMLGWEGRFEPVTCAGKWVILSPLQHLAPGDRFLLLVTLSDGTELPFTVTAPEQNWASVDQQVNVFVDPETPDALRSQLKEARERERALEEASRLHWKQDTEDYALAKLLSTGALEQTSFMERKRRILKTESGVDMVVQVLAGKQKAAVLFTVTNNHSSKPWSALDVRLRATRPGDNQQPPFLFGEEKSFALRTGQDEIAPGQSGTVAVVIDKSAFTKDGGFIDILSLELYRQDGAMDAFVLLDRRLIHE